jgi:hypothetical protein
MTILNFSFNKILVEKTGTTTKQLNIKSSMNIIDVAPSDVVKGTDQKAYRISFGFDVTYEPKYATILLQGSLIFLADDAVAKNLEESWKNKKSLPKDVALNVFNKILHNCNVEALILSKEIGLPAPIQLPKVKMNAAEQEKK